MAEVTKEQLDGLLQIYRGVLDLILEQERNLQLEKEQIMADINRVKRVAYQKGF